MQENTNNISFDDILEVWIDKDASDIHLGTNDQIALRIQGKLHFVEQCLTREWIENIVFSIINNQQKEMLQKEKRLNFSYNYKEKFCFRISIYYKKGQICMAIHTIDKEIITLEKLGVPPTLQDLLQNNSGIIFISGSHNSGTSNTMRSIIEHINQTQTKHIITIEKPAEYIFTPNNSFISQCEIWTDTASYKEALETSRYIDADVVAIDNTDDPDIFLSLLKLAETGHLVIAILPIMGVTNVLNTIINFFPPEKHSYIQNKLSTNLLGILSQKLLPQANQSGMIPVFELLTVNSNVSNLIKSGSFAQIRNAMQAGISQGMMTMDYYAKKLLEQGYIEQEQFDSIATED